MIDQNNSDPGKSGKGSAGPFDGMTAATAVGFAMAAQAMEMWFGIVSGAAKATQEILTSRHDAIARQMQPAVPSPTAEKAAPTAGAVSEMKSAATARPNPASASEAKLGVDRTADVLPFPIKADKTAATAKPKQTKPAKPKAKVSAEAAETTGPVEGHLAPVVDAPSAEPSETVTKKVAQAEPIAAATHMNPKIETAEETPATVADIAGDAAVPEKPAPAAADAGQLMPEDFRTPKALDKPEASDDLKLISGVGPKLEKVLNGLGIWTLAQVAGWEREEIAWVDDYLGLNGRIARDDWAGQAAALANGAKAVG